MLLLCSCNKIAENHATKQVSESNLVLLNQLLAPLSDIFLSDSSEVMLVICESPTSRYDTLLYLRETYLGPVYSLTSRDKGTHSWTSFGSEIDRPSFNDARSRVLTSWKHIPDYSPDSMYNDVAVVVSSGEVIFFESKMDSMYLSKFLSTVK